MASDAEARRERERLAPGRQPEGEGRWLDTISVDDCWYLLETVGFGRIGFTAHSGQPLILPVNYAVVDRQVLIRTGRGPKLEAARRGDRVAFEVDELDIDHDSGWSVTISGRARWIHDPAERAALAQSVPVPWASGPRNELIVIEPNHVGGRRMHRSNG